MLSTTRRTLLRSTGAAATLSPLLIPRKSEAAVPALLSNPIFTVASHTHAHSVYRSALTVVNHFGRGKGPLLKASALHHTVGSFVHAAQFFHRADAASNGSLTSTLVNHLRTSPESYFDPPTGKRAITGWIAKNLPTSKAMKPAASALNSVLSEQWMPFYSKEAFSKITAKDIYYVNRWHVFHLWHQYKLHCLHSGVSGILGETSYHSTDGGDFQLQLAQSCGNVPSGVYVTSGVIAAIGRFIGVLSGIPGAGAISALGPYGSAFSMAGYIAPFVAAYINQCPSGGPTPTYNMYYNQPPAFGPVDPMPQPPDTSEYSLGGGSDLVSADYGGGAYDIPFFSYDDEADL